MRSFRQVLAVLTAVAGIGTATSALADNPLGLYVGAGIGQSRDRSDDYELGYREDLTDRHAAWKAIVGVRPLSIVGGEVEYIDFGYPGGDSDYYDYYHYRGPNSHPRAAAAFAVGYLPIPLPFLDVFGKFGVAALHMNLDTPVTAPDGSPGYVRNSRWDTRPAYGAGVQAKLFGVSLRGEYERISSQFGDPELWAFSATWTF